MEKEPEVLFQTAEQLLSHAAKWWDIDGIKIARSHRGLAWVNHNLKIASLGIPKCATTSIRLQFELTELINIQDIPNNYFTFVIIREPVSRFVSAYIEVIQPTDDYPKGRYDTDLEISQDQIEFLDDLMKSHDDCERFTIYLNQIQHEWGFFELHCVPQVVYLLASSPNIEIFKMNDLTDLETRLGSTIHKCNQSENSELKQKLLAFIAANVAVKDQIELYLPDSISSFRRPI